ncbi:MAG TPA: hypothetical protein VGN14_15685 [Candidatus Elarobacter sp.]
MQLVLPRFLTAIGTAAVLAACSSASGTGPMPGTSGNLGPQSAARQTVAAGTTAASTIRSTASHHEKPDLAASPSSVDFVSGDSPAQTVAITGKDDNRPYDVTIAGTGNCPTVSPATLRLKHAASGHHGDGDGRHSDDDDRDGAATATITVTPNGAGPATCTITIAQHDGDAKHDADDSLTIPVTVGGATPTPVPTPTFTPTPSPR